MTSAPRGSKYDPRSKLVLVMCLSSLAVFVNEVHSMLIIAVFAGLVSAYLQSQVGVALKRFRMFLWVFLAMAFVQSIFIAGGETLLGIGDFALITTVGLQRAASVVLRFLIIIISATVMGTSSSRDVVQGLYQWRLPYEVAFMVALAIRFLPLLQSEASDMFTAIQLRGVKLQEIPLRKKLQIYTYLVTPMISGIINKAHTLALAVEIRGFRAYEQRTSYRTLEFAQRDYILMFLSVAFSAAMLWIAKM